MTRPHGQTEPRPATAAPAAAAASAGPDARQRARRTRARLRHAALTRIPMRLSGGAVARVGGVFRFRVVERTLRLPRLPRELDGLRIVHLSDLHIGDILPPERLPRIVQSVHELQPDLIAATGDFVDFSLDVLDRVRDSLLELTAPLGVFLVPGNHDHLIDGPGLIRRLRSAGLRLLINEHLLLRHRGRSIVVAGIDFAHRKRHIPAMLRRAFDRPADHHPPDLSLLLAHHPDAFDLAHQHHIDLTLAGHTHGGQFTLWPTRGRRGSIGLGSLAFKYPHGVYRRDAHLLHVTTGLGAWFPLRFRCPPEIACLTLRAERHPDPASESRERNPPDTGAPRHGASRR